jgi:hypothetical protein
MRERKVGLRVMIILSDALEKDRAWQRFNYAGSRFLLARA